MSVFAMMFNEITQRAAARAGVGMQVEAAIRLVTEDGFELYNGNHSEFGAADVLVNRIRSLESECAALKAENEAMANEMRACSANERRYLWLRNEAQYTDDKSGPFCILWKRTGHAQEILAEDDLDEAVDSAMWANIQNDAAMQAGDKP